MNSIYAVEYQIFAAELRLKFFLRLYDQGVTKFASHDVRQEIEFLRKHLAGLEAVV